MGKEIRGWLLFPNSSSNLYTYIHARADWMCWNNVNALLFSIFGVQLIDFYPNAWQHHWDQRKLEIWECRWRLKDYNIIQSRHLYDVVRDKLINLRCQWLLCHLQLVKSIQAIEHIDWKKRDQWEREREREKRERERVKGGSSRRLLTLTLSNTHIEE